MLRIQSYLIQLSPVVSEPFFKDGLKLIHLDRRLRTINYPDFEFLSFGSKILFRNVELTSSLVRAGGGPSGR